MTTTYKESTVQAAEEVKQILSDSLPSGFIVTVSPRRGFFLGDESISVSIRPTDYEISRVKGQYPAVVSLSLDPESWELEPQIYGGMGGNRIHVTPPEGSRLALEAVKIPFRRPKRDKRSAYRAIERFADRYLAVLKDNKDRLRYTEHYTEGAREYLSL